MRAAIPPVMWKHVPESDPGVKEYGLLQYWVPESAHKVSKFSEQLGWDSGFSAETISLLEGWV